ncbi:head decoration protein [Sphingomonas bacterium]|uniref:head decoration protein n=1 Tax=Sphingomonas bacterium TaxID=1895847 RepID=UPI0015772166|nr:head decoration protein [Sphingomonas bacterium]
MYERASRTVEALNAPKTFIRGQALLRTRKVTLLAGAIYLAASVLGIATAGTASAAAKPAGNTGNGTISAPTVGQRVKTGAYTARLTSANTFEVIDPEGVVIEAAAATGAAYAGPVGFTITPGANAFVAGDAFIITVAAGTSKAMLATAAATDGSQSPSLVLAYDADATAGDVEAIAYESGDFVKEQLIFGAGLTADSTREQLRRLNITMG